MPGGRLLRRANTIAPRLRFFCIFFNYGLLAGFKPEVKSIVEECVLYIRRLVIMMDTLRFYSVFFALG